MKARDGCAGGDGRSCVHSIMAQRCPCGISAITYTVCICCLFEQSVYAHVLPAHFGAAAGRGRHA
eukprot:7055000-Prorocentrum_lima.AAC.1